LRHIAWLEPFDFAQGQLADKRHGSLMPYYPFSHPAIVQVFKIPLLGNVTKHK